MRTLDMSMDRNGCTEDRRWACMAVTCKQKTKYTRACAVVGGRVRVGGKINPEYKDGLCEQCLVHLSEAAKEWGTLFIPMHWDKNVRNAVRKHILIVFPDIEVLS